MSVHPVKYSDIPDPHTGVKNRTATIQKIRITSLENYYPHKDHTEIVEDFSKLQQIVHRPVGLSKCVYQYEDRYTFTRILTPDTLLFNSHFESGNLYSAHRLFPQSDTINNSHQFYDLYLHEDINSAKGNIQWFYFAVSNMKARQSVTFSICNCSKSDSLFKDGLRPVFYSRNANCGWKRCGYDIRFSEDNTSEQQSNNTQNKYKNVYYVLRFTITFPYDNDLCYFAYSHPYTYTDLKYFLKSSEIMCADMGILRRSILCKTIAGNDCDLLTITSKTSSSLEAFLKPVIVITGRVHPGETCGSWIVHGMIKFLLSNHSTAIHLRNTFLFKIIPMLNPDGVVNGNTRTSLSGVDLNRQWINPNMLTHPTIYYTKKLVADIASDPRRTICLFLDLHAHSTKKGVFTFGCFPDRIDIEAVLNTQSSYLPRSSSPIVRPVSATKIVFGNMYRNNSTSNSSNSNNRAKIKEIRDISTGKPCLPPRHRPSKQSSINVIPVNPVRDGESTASHSVQISDDDNNSRRSDGNRGVKESDIKTSALSDRQINSKKKSVESKLDENCFLQLFTPLTAPNIPVRIRSKDKIDIQDAIRQLPKQFERYVSGFSTASCDYRVFESKYSSARVVMSLEMGILCSYTVEASMAGPEHGSLYRPSDLIIIGEEMCHSIYRWVEEYPSLLHDSKNYMNAIRSLKSPLLNDSTDEVTSQVSKSSSRSKLRSRDRNTVSNTPSLISLEKQNDNLLSKLQKSISMKNTPTTTSTANTAISTNTKSKPNISILQHDLTNIRPKVEVRSRILACELLSTVNLSTVNLKNIHLSSSPKKEEIISPKLTKSPKLLLDLGFSILAPPDNSFKGTATKRSPRGNSRKYIAASQSFDSQSLLTPSKSNQQESLGSSTRSDSKRVNGGISEPSANSTHVMSSQNSLDKFIQENYRINQQNHSRSINTSAFSSSPCQTVVEGNQQQNTALLRTYKLSDFLGELPDPPRYS